MKDSSTRRTFIWTMTSAISLLTFHASGQNVSSTPPQRGERGRRARRQVDYVLPQDLSLFALLSAILGRISDRAVTISLLAAEPMDVFVEYGTSPGQYVHKTKSFLLAAGNPTEILLDGLLPDTQYVYRVQYRTNGQSAFTARPECHFHTQRRSGRAFVFAIQGDSHPERPQMSEPNLYARTLQKAAEDHPDFYICMGDDFSADPVANVNEKTISERYTLQRPFLGLIGQTAPLFLLNGNHEQASLFNYNQTDVRHDVAVLAQNARNKYFPTPAPDVFYSGNSQKLQSIGPLKDYCAWTWGDALFVILDNYWQSPAQVDSAFHETDFANNTPKPHNRDWWGITMGDAQYQWFKKTLEQCKARYKFVFAHHVLGTGRGGIEQADLFEWGGQNRRGDWQFNQMRPNWELPVHQLMVKHGVSIFFQGHDHLFARQEKDGVIYQEVPQPADPFYVAHNEGRYLSGTKLPNSGYLRVTVSPENVKVEYVRCYLPQDQNDKQKTGDVAFSYTVKPRVIHA